MILVIGIGNLLCGDDGIGPRVAVQLGNDAACREDSQDVEYLAVHQLTPELSEPISRADAVIFIDAAVGATPGEISCFSLSSAPGQSDIVLDTALDTAPGAFTHHVNVTTLLQSAEFLFGQRPDAYLYTVVGGDFTLGASFSPPVEDAVPDLLARLKTRIDQCMNTVSLRVS